MEAVLPEMIEAAGFPLSLAFTKDGRAFLSERISGRLWQVDHGFRLVKAFPIVPILGHHETGLLGIALDPDFTENHWIYVYYTVGPNPEKMENRVVRIKDDGSAEEVLLDHLPAGWIHNGGIMAFGPDNTLYIGVGVDNPVMEHAQDIKSLDGKILRINADGSLPKDNPFPDSPVYSFGHRNIFGLAFHPQTGQLYISEEGPFENDEINLIQKGGNYGWPKVTGFTDNPEFVNPLLTYTPTVTPTQNVFVGGNLYFGTYNDGAVHKLTLTGENFDRVAKDEIVFQEKPFDLVGVFYGPDNHFYLTTANRVIRADF